MSDYKERLKANAEEFDTIVSGMLARITDLEAKLAKHARIVEAAKDLITRDDFWKAIKILPGEYDTLVEAVRQSEVKQ